MTLQRSDPAQSQRQQSAINNLLYFPSSPNLIRLCISYLDVQDSIPLNRLSVCRSSSTGKRVKEQAAAFHCATYRAEEHVRARPLTRQQSDWYLDKLPIVSATTQSVLPLSFTGSKKSLLIKLYLLHLSPFKVLKTYISRSDTAAYLRTGYQGSEPFAIALMFSWTALARALPTLQRCAKMSLKALIMSSIRLICFRYNLTQAVPFNDVFICLLIRGCTAGQPWWFLLWWNPNRWQTNKRM